MRPDDRPFTLKWSRTWTLADRRQIALGYAPTTRAARTAVEKAYRDWRAKQ